MRYGACAVEGGYLSNTRYPVADDQTSSNFIGEKIVRRVTMLQGVDVEISKNVKDELTLTGNSLENVSQSAADIQQICRVRNKDIRKVMLFLLKQLSTHAHAP